MSENAIENVAGSFAEQVDFSLAAWRKKGARTELLALATLLGCPFANGGLNTAPLLPEDELLVQKTWITLLHTRFQSSFLPRAVELHTLTGLLTNDRWRTLLDDENSTYTFIVMAASFLNRVFAVSSPNPPSYGYQHLQTSKQLHRALGPWLTTDVHEPLTERNLAVAFFGEAWCTLVFDSQPDIPLDRLVEADQPPLLPGRLTVDTEHVGVKLPDLGC